MLGSPYFLRDNTEMTADPLSDIIKLANAQSVVSGGFTAGGSWAIRFPEPDKIKFFALLKGNCWLCIDGIEAPVRVETGDVILLSAKRSFVLAGDLAAVPVDATSLFTGSSNKTAKLGDSEDCIQIGGHVRLDPASGGLLADVLPPLIHVRDASPQATVLQWLLDQLVRERAMELPGTNIVSAQLAQLMFVQTLRVHLADSESLPAGWLRALGDARIAPALRLMHGDPGRPWQLGELAKSAAMSRTTFALRFKTVTGVPPLTYMLNWRMRIAARALREDDTPISALALALGYTSESAFSNAFKRALGMAPKHFRDAARAR
jgi:AraC-like DNA-binding protein